MAVFSIPRVIVPGDRNNLMGRMGIFVGARKFKRETDAHQDLHPILGWNVLWRFGWPHHCFLAQLLGVHLPSSGEVEGYIWVVCNESGTKIKESVFGTVETLPRLFKWVIGRQEVSTSEALYA